MSRGRPTKTPARLAEARYLREVEGLKEREISERLGIARSTVHTWLRDPDGSRGAARRAGYAGVCDTCGGSTNGSNGRGKAATRCLGCLTWTREGLIEALTGWFEEHGEPPRCKEAEGSDVLPPVGSVARVFGSWNEGLAAAGIPIVCERRPEIWEDIRRRYLAGEAVAALAEERGCTSSNISQHLRRHGIPRRAA